jgi:hypothetical protein
MSRTRDHLSPDLVAAMQRTAGNQAVLRLVTRARADRAGAATVQRHISEEADASFSENLPALQQAIRAARRSTDDMVDPANALRRAAIASRELASGAAGAPARGAMEEREHEARFRR